jgi:hypothetical protein
MMKYWSKLKSKRSLAAILVAGGLSLAFLPHDAFKGVTQELIAMFGLMMAGVLPTMVLTASVLRAGNLSVKTLKQYRDALRGQMLIWIGLFLVSMVASLLVIVGKMLDWSVLVKVPLAWLKQPDFIFQAIPILNMLVVMALALVVFRAVAVGNGIISLLRLSAELAISEAQLREDDRHKAAELEIAKMSEREGFGSYVSLPSELPSAKSAAQRKSSARHKN